MLTRGVYNARTERVRPAVLHFLPPLPAGAQPDRLGLAEWTVSPTNPLTARVTVNRMWQEIFGTGIVETTEDFGVMGARPSHPELLDWLAVDFRDSGWDVKRFYKQLVMSAAYRQSARVTPQLAEKDPKNRLLARGPRFRMDSEMLRDTALAASTHFSKTGTRVLANASPEPFSNWFLSIAEDVFVVGLGFLALKYPAAAAVVVVVCLALIVAFGAWLAGAVRRRFARPPS